MDYANEEWMKVYTRNTPEWLDLSLVARGLALEVNRLMGRFSDELPLGRGGLKAIATIVAARWSAVEPALRELLDAGVLEHDQERGVIRDPRHLERQRSASSPAQRKRDERANARAEGVNGSVGATSFEEPPNPLPIPEENRMEHVTRGHAESRNVTIRREEKRSEESENARARDSCGAPEPAPSHARAREIVELDEDLRAWAVTAGAPEPTRDHLEAFELNAAQKGLLFADRRAGFKRWMLREKAIAAKERERDRAFEGRRAELEAKREAPLPFHLPAPSTRRAREASKADRLAAPEELAALMNLQPLTRSA